MILDATPRALVMLLVCVGGAASATVPVAAEGGASWVDEPSFIVLATSGFGPIPNGFGTTLSCVVGVCGQA